MIYDICIIGAGASGMAAAICAARSGASVALVERLARCGKKILVTGNGRCNLSNTALSDTVQNLCYEEYYRGRQPAFVQDVLSSFSTEKVIRFMNSVGIFTHTRDSYVYPRSDQAAAVRNALELAMQETDRIHLFTGTAVRAISADKAQKERSLFHVYAEDETGIRSRSVILAAGGCAAPKQGSDGSGYELARMLGHRIITPLPALTALHCEEKYFKDLSGVRCQAKVILFSKRKELAADQGEVQLTSYGISGIPVFQVSRFASCALHEGSAVTAKLDFFPDLQHSQLSSIIKASASAHPSYNMPTVLSGIMHDKLALVLSRLACKEYKNKPAARWTGKDLAKLIDLMKEHTLHITATNGFDQSQVSCGGVDTSQIDPRSLESRITPGLYIIGELLDIDGICGGFNLHWAFAAGCTAGIHAAKRRKHAQD